jgi:predicted nucleotidyltransferase
MAKARVKSKTKGMTGQNRISPRAKEAILSFVDQFVPPGSTGVWLTGSRAKGSARPDSDWDVVAFHPAVSKRPEDLFKANQIGPHPLGGEIELVIAHPEHWNDPRQYMSDLRTYGIKLR